MKLSFDKMTFVKYLYSNLWLPNFTLKFNDKSWFLVQVMCCLRYWRSIDRRLSQDNYISICISRSIFLRRMMSSVNAWINIESCLPSSKILLEFDVKKFQIFLRNIWTNVHGIMESIPEDSLQEWNHQSNSKTKFVESIS